MRPLDKVETDCNTNGKGDDHLIFGDYSIVAGTRGMGVVDISDPLRLKMALKIEDLDSGSSMYQRAISLCYDDNILCCYDHRGFYTINIPDVFKIKDKNNYSIYDSSATIVPTWEEFYQKFNWCYDFT